jgi:hypothetical protein
MLLYLKIFGFNLKSNNNNTLILAIKRPTNTMSIISSDYVSNDRLVHFEKIKKTIELAYNQVIESLNEQVLPYMPNVYPIPFMIAKTYTVHAKMVRVLFYSIVYPDKSNFDILAIYPTLTVIERLPQYLTGMIGHEVAHIIALEGKVSISKSDLYSILRDREESAKSKEKKAKAVYKFFNESLLSEITRWDQISMQKETEEIVAKDVQLISQQKFDRIVFQEKRNHFYDFIKSKLNESEQN